MAQLKPCISALSVSERLGKLPKDLTAAYDQFFKQRKGYDRELLLFLSSSKV